MRFTRTELFVLVLVLVIVAGAGYFTGVKKGVLTPDSLIACFPAGNRELPKIDAGCLKTTVQGLLSTYSAAQLLEYLAATSSPSTLSTNCHPIAHAIGEETYARTRSVEVALSKCVNGCRYGCVHGVIGSAVADEIGTDTDNVDIAHADTATLKSVGRKYCTSSSRVPVCHTMGHIFFINEEEYDSALAACTDIAVGADNIETCYQGVFMQAAGGFANSLFAKTPTSVDQHDDYADPCSSIGSRYKHACLMNLTYFQVNLFVAKGIDMGDERLTIAKNTCEDFSGKARSDCFENIGMHLDRLVPSYIEHLGVCDTLSSSMDRRSCVLGVAFNFTTKYYYTSGANYCHLSAGDSRELCYDVLFQNMEKNKHDHLVQTYCDKAEAGGECAAAHTVYLAHKATLPNYYEGLPATSFR